ncbi:MAG TPA: hypothetical protein VML95_12740 [Longimicrobiales bacterium]|nr:hypothetical protein [Longimicrobiales bacterium]
MTEVYVANGGRRGTAGIVPLLLALALSACGEDVAGPPAAGDSIEDELSRLDGDVLELGGGQTDMPSDVAAFMEARERDRPPVESRSLLVALTHRAIRLVGREQGPEAARALLAPILESLQKAKRARRAGEFEMAREFLLEARLGMARIVVRVLGPEVSVRVLDGVSERVRVLFARLQEAEANGEEHPRVRALLERAAELLRESRRALENGHPALSLERSTRAADLLHHWLDVAGR